MIYVFLKTLSASHSSMFTILFTNIPLFPPQLCDKNCIMQYRAHKNGVFDAISGRSKAPITFPEHLHLPDHLAQLPQARQKGREIITLS